MLPAPMIPIFMLAIAEPPESMAVGTVGKSAPRLVGLYFW